MLWWCDDNNNNMATAQVSIKQWLLMVAFVVGLPSTSSSGGSATETPPPPALDHALKIEKRSRVKTYPMDKTKGLYTIYTSMKVLDILWVYTIIE